MALLGCGQWLGDQDCDLERFMLSYAAAVTVCYWLVGPIVLC